MYNNFDGDRSKTYIEPLKWCRYIVNVGYATAVLMILAHVIWYFAAFGNPEFFPDIYLRNYIILPAISLIAITILADLLVRARFVSLIAKEYISLSLFIIFSAYLAYTHEIARVLMASFILPIFVSTIFSNVKITRWMFLLSCLSVTLLGVKIYFEGRLGISILVQIFVSCFMFLCAYLLAKILIRYGLNNISALKEFGNQHKYMQEQLKLDQFTGLYNRKTFDDYLSILMEDCRSTNKCLSLAMLDVDNFKSVNDQYGHAVGDRVLLYLSQILKDIKAENIHIFRVGGEEFAVLFRDCDAEEAYRICEDMRTRMEATSLHDIDNKTVTFSCGLVCMNPKDYSREAFAKAADCALYAAKNNGRNKTVIYNDLIESISKEKEKAYV